MTSPDVQVFDFEGSRFRAFAHEENVCVLAKDICEAIGIGNPADAADRLDPDEIGIVSIDTNRGPRRMQYVTESGMYSLILGSRKHKAKRFNRWVTHEVLPQIRQTGSYTNRQLTTGEQFLALARWQVAQERRAALTEQRVEKLEAGIDDRTDYCTVRGFARIKKEQMHNELAKAIGKRATKLSKEQEILIGEVPDERHGAVNCYHTSILEEVFREFFSE